MIFEMIDAGCVEVEQLLQFRLKQLLFQLIFPARTFI